MKIEAINFQEKLGGTIQYTVYENSNTQSTRFAVDNGNLKTLQPLDYESDPHQFTLTVMALDSYSGYSNNAVVSSFRIIKSGKNGISRVPDKALKSLKWNKIEICYIL